MSSNQRFHNSNRRSNDPDFDLDDYLEEKGQNEFTEKDESVKEIRRRNIKNGVLLTLIIVAFGVWDSNFKVLSDWRSFLGFSESETVNTEPIVVNIPPINIDIPEINIPDIDIDIDPDFSGNEADLGPVLEYLQELQNQGLLDSKISAFEAREVHKAGVPINYLLELDQRGYLGELSFIEIGEFYKNEVPFEYLDQLKEQGFYERLSFIEVVEFYRNDVSFEYLEIMDQAGYLDELSFVHIAEYYKNGVTPEFLDELKESGLYNSLSFIDVVEIYKSQN